MVPKTKFGLNDSFRSHSKIKISSELLVRTIHLLDNLDTDELDSDIMMLYGYVLHAFNLKRAKINLKERQLKNFHLYKQNGFSDEHSVQGTFSFDEPF
jgi:hypothetical protein